MPRHKEGFTQIAMELPDDVLAASRKTAAEEGMTLTAWITTRCAEAVGVEYTPPKLGRPPAEPDPPPPKRRGRKGRG